MVATGAPAALPRNPVLPGAQDFDALKAEGVALLQQLCGHWTDYNAHDPGVTLLELLSYALTDLGYRAALPIEDLLATVKPDGPTGLYPAWRALPSPPVTIVDFRRLLLDRVEGLANVWLTPRRAADAVPGLYDIRLHPVLPLPGVHPEGRHRYRDLVQRTRRAFLRHRPLCEDIGSIRVLRPLRTIVSAGLEIDTTARAEGVLAEALFRLALTLAPEPHRTGLDADDPASAFDGPLLRDGAIASDALADKPAVVDPEALADILRAIPGVLRVTDLRLWIEETGLCKGVCRVGADDYCSLDAGIESDALPLALSVGGRACPVDRGEVLRRLLRRWETHRARSPIKAASRAAFPLPRGRVRTLTALAPLGPQLPRVYGLAEPGRPDGPAAAQLAGFLGIFEGVMADFCARLGSIDTLVAGAIPPALSPVEREKLLDLLLALYGVAADCIPLPPRLRLRPAAAARYRVAIKQSLLDHRATFARRNGRGFDPAARSRTRRISGAELRGNLLLGEAPGRHARVCLIEHMMLRPRGRERRACEASRYRYAMAVSAAVALHEDERADAQYRAEVQAMLRAELPAHIGLHLHFVDPGRWRRLHDLRHLWRASLALDERHAADQLAVELRNLLERWSRRERGGA
ncbi:hypothetical protein FHS95_002605 [Sphingomonas naasensis]|uniref:Uncharacterized protein n=1 Tax=Sphingomonas naasensis TaxID=1344951 RepID=A0A4S1WKP6_9SPHN|nr:hypothetical protein [Sphingomonas naasensis]NIJ20913.1 hypothetical protein [Sphingomonas naasensis]TGX43303.1 hypothetical protein E5A74_09060 [Sphingomonas naasensis]